MTRFCLAATLIAPLSAQHCDLRPAVIATDRGRCWGEGRRIKAPRPVPVIHTQEQPHGGR